MLIYKIVYFRAPFTCNRHRADVSDRDSSGSACSDLYRTLKAGKDLTKSNHQPSTAVFTTSSYPQGLPGMGAPPLPQAAVSVPDHPFSEEIFPNIQPKPTLMDLEAIFSHPVTCYLGEEPNPPLSYNFLSGSCREL